MQLLSKVSQNTQLMVLVNMQGTIVSSSKWQGKSEAFSSNFKSRKHSNLLLLQRVICAGHCISKQEYALHLTLRCNSTEVLFLALRLSTS